MLISVGDKVYILHFKHNVENKKTYCKIREKNTIENKIFECNHNQNFCKAIERKKVLSIALKDIFPGKENKHERTEFWKYYSAQSNLEPKSKF